MKIQEKFPTVSAMAIIEIRERNSINYLYAGTTALMEAADLDRLIGAIESAPLIERNGWLVLPDSFQRN